MIGTPTQSAKTPGKSPGWKTGHPHESRIRTIGGIQGDLTKEHQL
ncbi:MAG: hypothetical protein RM021_012050 [Nostoc sp. EkiNYC01]|nr:hypothetical protein [Nostoc sp. EkiNYC01]